ncbi:MAG: aminopeptidase P family protein, partial [Methanothermobacter sp.]|nr:aminopeptidase P family protein [Methanothermobacter sp.]
HEEGERALITSRENIYYLSGFMPTATSFLILADEPVLFVSEMDRESAMVKSSVDVRSFRRLSDVSESCDLAGILVEPATPVGILERLGINRDFRVKDPVSDLRMVKDREELKKMEEALRIAENSFKKLEFKGTEIEIAARLDYSMRLAGSEGVSFDTIVASSVRSSIPHAVPAAETTGSPVLIDWGALMEGYHSDTTRTIVEGEREHEILEIVLEAKRAGVRALKPGARACDVDSAVREVIAEYGYGENFIHSTGHGVGLDVHEKPSLAAGDETVLRRGMVLTVEPGIYIPGEFGVRVEDMVLVGEGIMNRLPDTI